MALDKDGSVTGHAMKAYNQEPEQGWENKWCRSRYIRNKWCRNKWCGIKGAKVPGPIYSE